MSVLLSLPPGRYIPLRWQIFAGWIYVAEIFKKETANAEQTWKSSAIRTSTPQFSELYTLHPPFATRSPYPVSPEPTFHSCHKSSYFKDPQQLCSLPINTTTLGRKGDHRFRRRNKIH